jgi:hypothetical protein
MGKKTFSVYLDESRAAKAASTVVKQSPYDGNFSAYIDELLKRDLEGAPPPLGDKPDVLAELARHYHPTLASEITATLARKQFNEQRIVARLLEGLAEALKDDEFDPRTQLAIVDAKAMKKWEAIGDDRILTAAQALAAKLNKDGAAALLQLNEAAADVPRSPVTEEIERHEQQKRTVAPGGDAATVSNRPRKRDTQKIRSRPGA